MRNRPVTPGQQLASVAARYRSPWSRTHTGAGPATVRRPFFALLRTASRAVSADLEDPAVRLSQLEAVLFLAKEPLPSRRLAQLANLADGTEARTLVRRLNSKYDSSARSFRVEEVAGGYQLRTRQQFAPWLRRMAGAPAEIRMSGPALETLSVVAYRQPVLRAEIETVRGVQCGEILRQLMERGMVRISGRANELGRPFLYSTTKKFLQVFGLRNLDELPRASMLRKSGAPTDGPMLDETAAVAAGEQVGERVDDKEKEPTVTTTRTLPERNQPLDDDQQFAVPTNERTEYEEELEDEYDEEEDDDDYDDDDEDEDELEDDDFADEEWEEVEDELDEESDWDEDEDEDWDDDDDEWDDDDDDDDY